MRITRTVFYISEADQRGRGLQHPLGEKISVYVLSKLGVETTLKQRWNPLNEKLDPPLYMCSKLGDDSTSLKIVHFWISKISS